MSSNQAELLKQFADVTGTTEERSRFFLDSSNWQLEVALSSFFEHGGNVEEPVQPPPAQPAQPVQVLCSDTDDTDMESPPRSPLKPKKKEKKRTNQTFATLSTLQHSSSSDEEEGQAFYAGGSERSGQQIIGPAKGGRRDFVAEMFKSARERGAVVAEDEPSGSRQSSGFSGMGYRLGQTPDDHVPVPAAQARNQESVRSVRLQLFREGFTVDAGPLRQYSDPENAEFLDCVRRGEIPPELSSDGGEVRVSLEDRRREEYSQVGPKLQPFAGKGHTLGSPTPPTVGATAPVAADVSDKEANERAAQTALGLDEAQPVTTLQIRLADGNRLIGRFNHTHTVGDVRRYLTTAVPSYQLRNFVLMTTFPSAELSDPTATIASAKLLNSVVQQRLV